MLTILSVIGLLVGIVTILQAYYYLKIPLLSYQQGEENRLRGKVVEIKQIRGGVIEIGVQQDLELEKPQNDHENIQFIAGSITCHVHTRDRSNLPSPGDVIEVVSTNRFHRFSGRSLNWINHWKIYSGELLPGGTVCIY